MERYLKVKLNNILWNRHQHFLAGTLNKPDPGGYPTFADYYRTTEQQIRKALHDYSSNR